jgi:hypothetical protein
MASVQVFPAMSGSVRRKRCLDECGHAGASAAAACAASANAGRPGLAVAAGAASQNGEAAVAKRRCRHSSLDAVLRSDVHGFARYAARRATLADRALPDAAVARLLAGLGGDPHTLLRIVDLNVFAPRVSAILAELSTRGAPLATMNVRVHNFSIARKDAVLANFSRACPGDPWLRDVVAFVANDFFPNDHCISLSVLSGGGVRDVLVADWCAMYKIGPGQVPPQLVIVTGESGQNFFVPYQPQASSR